MWTSPEKEEIIGCTATMSSSGLDDFYVLRLILACNP